jgi:hypothetical protein
MKTATAESQTRHLIESSKKRPRVDSGLSKELFADLQGFLEGKGLGGKAAAGCHHVRI